MYLNRRERDRETERQRTEERIGHSLENFKK